MTRKNTGPTGLDAILGITQGLGQIFDGLKDVLEKGEAASKEGGVYESVNTFGKAGSPFSGVAGMRMKMGTGVAEKSEAKSDVVSKSKVKSAKPASQNDVVTPTKNDAIETIDIEDAFLIIAEMPGVAPEDLKIRVLDGIVHIETTGKRVHRHSVTLPFGINEADVKINMRNGILEIRLAKVK